MVGQSKNVKFTAIAARKSDKIPEKLRELAKQIEAKNGGTRVMIADALKIAVEEAVGRRTG